MTDPLMTSDELASRLKLSRAHIYRMARERRIPHTRIGTHLRFDRAEIEQWLATRHQQVVQ